MSPSDSAPLSPAASLARTILDGFDCHYRLFRDCSRLAQANFEAGKVHAQRDAVRDRITFFMIDA